MVEGTVELITHLVPTRKQRGHTGTVDFVVLWLHLDPCLLDGASHLQGDFCLVGTPHGTVSENSPQAHPGCALLISVYLNPSKEEIKSSHPKTSPCHLDI